MRDKINYIIKNRKRYTAAVMTAILACTTVLNHASIIALAAETNIKSVIFELSAEELQADALDALKSGEIFDSTEFFGDDIPKEYDRLFNDDNGWDIYEFDPSIENSVSDKAELRTFVYAKDGADRLSNDAEIIFLFVNHDRDTLDFSVSVDGHTTKPVAVEGLSTATSSNADIASASDSRHTASAKATASNAAAYDYDDDNDDDYDEDDYPFEIELINDLVVEDDSVAMSESGILAATAMDSILLAGGSRARAVRVDMKDLRNADTTNVDFPAFQPEPVVIDDVTITLSAPAGVIPAGTTVDVKPIAQEDLSSLMDEAQVNEAQTANALADEAQFDDKLAAPETSAAPVILDRIGFDITLYDVDGNPVTFDDGTVTVTFSGAPIEEMTRNANTAMISHVDFETKTVENIMSEEIPVGETLEKVDFEAEHFSAYVFEAAVKNTEGAGTVLDGTELAVGFGFSDNPFKLGIWENGEPHIAYCHNYNEDSPFGFNEIDLNSRLGKENPRFTSETETLKGNNFKFELYGDNSNPQKSTFVKSVTINSSGADKLNYYSPLYFKHSYEDVITSDWIFDNSSTENADENTKKLMNLLYAGYPYDSYGLAAKYSILDIQACLMTQSLFWYLCDNDGKFNEGYQPAYIESILSKEAPTDPFEKYTKALYEAISSDDCRNPRLYLSGDTNMIADENNHYKSGLISTSSGFGGTFVFTNIPENYQI